MKHGIVTDTTAYLSKKEISDYDIRFASLNIMKGDEVHKESETSTEFVHEQLNEGYTLTTSQPSPGEFLHLYEQLIDDGVDTIFVITLAKPLSGTYQSAVLAKKMLDNPEVVHVFESNMAAFGNEMLVIELGEMVNAGNTKEEIVKRMNNLIANSELIFTIENLHHIAKSGRLSRAKALVGSVLRVKPLIKMAEGKLDLFHVDRTHKKVVNTIIKKIRETTQNASQINLRVLSHNSLEQAKYLELEIKKAFTNIKLTFNEYLGPVFCLHLGTTGYGVSWCSE